MSSAHSDVIREEFAKQSAGFEDPTYSFADPRFMRWILAHLPVEEDFAVLDVAGGTGHLARALAPLSHHAIVIDVTPEMLAVGKRAAEAAGVKNVQYQRGDAADLPFLDDSFDLVVSRFAVHHFAHPERQAAEMARVCRARRHVAIIDIVAADAERAAEYNHWERLRDPSHTEALTAMGLVGLLEGEGLSITETTHLDHPLPVSRWLAQAQATAQSGREIETALRSELNGGPATGMRPLIKDGELHLTHRFMIVVALKPDRGRV